MTSLFDDDDDKEDNQGLFGSSFHRSHDVVSDVFADLDNDDSDISTGDAVLATSSSDDDPRVRQSMTRVKRERDYNLVRSRKEGERRSASRRGLGAAVDSAAVTRKTEKKKDADKFGGEKASEETQTSPLQALQISKEKEDEGGLWTKEKNGDGGEGIGNATASVMESAASLLRLSSGDSGERDASFEEEGENEQGNHVLSSSVEKRKGSTARIDDDDDWFVLPSTSAQAPTQSSKKKKTIRNRGVEGHKVDRGHSSDQRNSNIETRASKKGNNGNNVGDGAREPDDGYDDDEYDDDGRRRIRDPSLRASFALPLNYSAELNVRSFV